MQFKKHVALCQRGKVQFASTTTAVAEKLLTWTPEGETDTLTHGYNW